MKILNAKIHGIIDYLVVIFLLLSPTLFSLSYPISLFVYALAGIHLTLTVLTDFPFGIVKVIPLKLHGWIELIVGIVLLFSPFVIPHFAAPNNPFDTYFLGGFGIAVLLTWFLTDYSPYQHQQS